MSLFEVFLVRMWENTDQKNFEYGDSYDNVLLIFLEDLENFALLHSLKSSFQKSMNECMNEIVDDTTNLQNMIEGLSEKLNRRAIQTENLFRAKICSNN